MDARICRGCAQGGRWQAERAARARPRGATPPHPAPPHPTPPHPGGWGPPSTPFANHCAGLLALGLFVLLGQLGLERLAVLFGVGCGLGALRVEALLKLVQEKLGGAPHSNAVAAGDQHAHGDQGPGHHHHHDDDVKSFVFKSKRPFDPAKLEDFLGTIVNIYGPKMLRYKGVLNMRGTERKVIFQGVHQLMGSDLGPEWAKGEERMSKMVFIGIDLPKDILMQGLEQSLV